MVKGPFIIVCICVQLFFVFFHIHKYSTIAKLSYEKQKKEKLINNLTEQKKELMHILENLKKGSTVKTWAKKEGMVPVRLSSIKRLNELT